MELTTVQYNEIRQAVKKSLSKRHLFLPKDIFDDYLQQTFIQILDKYQDKTFEELKALSCTIFNSIVIDNFKGLPSVNGTKIKKFDNLNEEDLPFEKFFDLFTNSNRIDVGEFNFFDIVEKIRWGGKIISPYTQSDFITRYPNGTYRDMSNKKYFTARTETIFDSIPLDWQNVFLIIYGYINKWTLDKIWKLRNKHTNSISNTRKHFESFHDYLNNKIPTFEELDIRKTLEILFDKKDVIDVNKIYNKNYSDEELIKILNSPIDYENDLIEVFKFLRWGEFIISPYDSTSIVYKRNGEFNFRCKNTKLNFSLTSKTLFQNTKLKFPEIFLIVKEVFYNKEITIQDLCTKINRNSQTCWKILYKIKCVIKNNSIEENESIILFSKKIFSYEFDDNILVPPIKRETSNTKKKIENSYIPSIRSRKEFEKEMFMMRINELKKGIEYLLNNNSNIPIEFIQEYNELLLKSC